MYYVYALFAESYDRLYVGLTSDINRRIAEHNSGRVKSTKRYLPWMLFYTEEYAARIKAREQEKRLKTSFGRKYLKEVLSKLRL